MSNTKINSWDWDVRVRERNLRSGVLTDKDVEKHLSQLADAAESCDPVSLGQPALSESADLGSDEDDDEAGGEVS